MKALSLVCLCLLGVVNPGRVAAGPYAPAAGQPGSTAIAAGDASIVGWATGVADLTRGSTDISDGAAVPASYGSGADALGAADATPVSATPVVSLGDGGSITVTFSAPIYDGAGYDFAVFENGFSDGYLELAFVEVSSNGIDFFRFDSISTTQTTTQIGENGLLDPTDIHNLAGKYRAGFGTPFDLNELASVSPLLDVSRVTHVRMVDVVGTLNPAFAGRDSADNIINERWEPNYYGGPTGQEGFDLDAVGVMNAIPEPGMVGLFLLGLGWIYWVRRR